MKKKIIRNTPFGSVAIIWKEVNRQQKIVRVFLSTSVLAAEDQSAKFYPEARLSSCAEIDAVAAAIKAFLAGDDVVFSLDALDFTLCSKFQESVLRAAYAIPRGSVSTYQLIAAQVGARGGARAVGNALANNPFPLIIPCHRVIRTDGHPGGYQGGTAMKRALLEMEGIL